MDEKKISPEEAVKLLNPTEANPNLLRAIKEVNGWFIPEPILKLVIAKESLHAMVLLREYHNISYQLAATIIQEVKIEVEKRSNGKDVPKD